tara:strand:- start:489 stop:1280 length:792 start_codon:yes stop_codon:yes gene_type:complete
MQTNHILQVNSLFYNIDSKDILEDISFDVNSGDFISIIGPNGSGKTTLIKLLSKDLDETKGKILFNSKNLKKWDSIDLSIKRSVLPQNNNLNFPFSVFDIVKMGRFPFESTMSRKENEGICLDLLDKFDLTNKKNQNYTTLSGGEKQRVQISRVIAQIWSLDGNYHEKLLLLDEPTSSLDIKHQIMLFNFLEKLNKKGLTIIVVLHDLNHAARLSNKFAVLKDARLVSFDSKSNIVASKVLNQVFDIEIKNLKINEKDDFFIF